MAFTVFIYEGFAVKDQKSFRTIQEAFAHIGTLDIATKVERCLLDDGTKILFDLKRDKDGNFTT